MRSMWSMRSLNPGRTKERMTTVRPSCVTLVSSRKQGYFIAEFN